MVAHCCGYIIEAECIAHYYYFWDLVFSYSSKFVVAIFWSDPFNYCHRKLWSSP